MNLSDHIALAALAAGKEILKVYENEFTVAYKTDQSPLTLADSKSHDIITQYLEQTPYPVLSEEGRDIPFEERSTWPYYWLVDPLDGTKEFVTRTGEFTVNIALIHQGKPVLGAVYTPVKKWLYIGSEGEGAWKLELQDHQLPENWKEAGQRLPLKLDQERSYTVVGSRSHKSKETDAFIAKLEKKHGQLNFVSMGSSLKICLVVEGTADIYPRLAPTMEWDTAAGDAVARSAGYQVVQYENGDPLLYNKENLLNPWFIVQR
ncbi:3'(2'),5'-bisphosphate nucleotidase [Pontibacter ummariensis]|uniref:3'(2'),5'-bisphosphate nucleotidase CysQ n=1 Tax=Pontibacter ummariensis TaxID=1610492 RepID=A0A239EIK6_9BACT|nr:3'(2'),5'-bisphosphate nucleotidase CysQ [Pontibacter ummariensis]PRY13281.1 3'(2'),5'-bisphosphate nucleotidase [Pontibacter ummariensis]SNS44485.1 3'(2'),5'-bisphosphate nucleotidase [Pontibacter ummariensis]